MTSVGDFRTAAPNASSPPIRAAVVDDSPLWVQAVTDSLNQSGRVTVEACAGSVSEAKAVLGQTRFDVYLVDMHLPDGTGLDVLQFLRDQDPDVKVVFLTVESRPSFAEASLRGGGVGYLDKNVRGSQLVQHLERVHAGGYAVDGNVAMRAFRGDRAEAKWPLTDREKQTLLHLCSGVTSDAALAELLFITPRTVKSHLDSLRRKLQVRDRAAVVAFAFSNGLVHLAPGGELVLGNRVETDKLP